MRIVRTKVSVTCAASATTYNKCAHISYKTNLSNHSTLVLSPTKQKQKGKLKMSTKIKKENNTNEPIGYYDDLLENRRTGTLFIQKVEMLCTAIATLGIFFSIYNIVLKVQSILAELSDVEFSELLEESVNLAPIGKTSLLLILMIFSYKTLIKYMLVSLRENIRNNQFKNNYTIDLAAISGFILTIVCCLIFTQGIIF